MVIGSFCKIDGSHTNGEPKGCHSQTGFPFDALTVIPPANSQVPYSGIPQDWVLLKDVVKVIARVPDDSSLATEILGTT